jgi:hypothetical protein
MNHISQRNKIEKQLNDYVKFISECPQNSVVKLSKEIVKLEQRLEEIKKMDLKQLNGEVVFHFETKQSQMNKINF